MHDPKVAMSLYLAVVCLDSVSSGFVVSGNKVSASLSSSVCKCDKIYEWNTYFDIVANV